MQFGVRYASAVGRGETGAAAMTFDLILIGLAIDQLIIAGSLILGSWLIGKSIYLIVS